ncbi:MAG: phosphoglycerate mutase family protein [Anaerolineales bacterium]|nr:phosphoglycerate mutase family protein [Anaerolineales bacterium]
MNTSPKPEERQAAQEKKPFPLLRYFTITSLAAFLLVGVSLVTFYRQTAVRELTELGESKNAALTQTFSNVIWPEFAPFLISASDLTADAIRAHPETARLREMVFEQMQGLSVIKVKIYTLDGKTVFSTEESQIGEDKSGNAGFLSARDGEIASELTHRDTFSAFEGEIEDRDVISSYVPIQRGGAGVEGVLEVYDDVTLLLENISISQRNILIGVTLILSLLYAALFLLIKRADNQIKRQFIEQLQAEQEIQGAYQREENVNEFFHFTLLNIIEYVNRGREKAELLTYLEQIKQQFNDLKYWRKD